MSRVHVPAVSVSSESRMREARRAAPRPPRSVSRISRTPRASPTTRRSERADAVPTRTRCLRDARQAARGLAASLAAT